MSSILKPLHQRNKEQAAAVEQFLNSEGAELVFSFGITSDMRVIPAGSQHLPPEKLRDILIGLVNSLSTEIVKNKNVN